MATACTTCSGGCRPRGVGFVADLGQVALGELVGVGDHQTTTRQVVDVGLEGGRGSSPPGRRGGHRRSGCRSRRSESGTTKHRAECPGAHESRPGSSVVSQRSLPKRAASEVNRSPVSCMPSPESPANRITTFSSFSRFAAAPLPFGPTHAFRWFAQERIPRRCPLTRRRNSHKHRVAVTPGTDYGTF